MKNLELFAGCGGLAKGMELAGFDHVGFLEYNHQACLSLKANFAADLVFEEDAKKFDFGRFKGVDVVSGGPPCQPFSLGGLAKANEDARDMFPQAIRAISEIQPKAFVFENVKGLLRKKFEPYFQYIIMRLSFPDCTRVENESWEEHLLRLQNLTLGSYKGARYDVWYKLLNAADYGVPQVRERVFIVGIRSDLNKSWTWPTPSCPTLESRKTIAQELKDVPSPQSHMNRIPDHQFIGGAKMYPGHTGSDVNKPSKTIKAGSHGVPGGENMLKFEDGSLRYMSVYEAKLIQTFPKSFKVTGAWGEAMRQIGNAVPVRLAKCVGKHLNSILNCSAKSLGQQYQYPEPDSNQIQMRLLESGATYSTSKFQKKRSSRKKD